MESIKQELQHKTMVKGSPRKELTQMEQKGGGTK